MQSGPPWSNAQGSHESAAHPVVGEPAVTHEVPHAFSAGVQSDDGAADEKPVHAVAVTTFDLDKHEVTVKDFKACVDAGKCVAPMPGEWSRPSPKRSRGSGEARRLTPPRPCWLVSGSSPPRCLGMNAGGG